MCEVAHKYWKRGTKRLVHGQASDNPGYHPTEQPHVVTIFRKYRELVP